MLVSCDLSERVGVDFTLSGGSRSSSKGELSVLFFENVARDSDPNSRPAWLKHCSPPALAPTGSTCDDKLWEISAVNNGADFDLNSI